MKGKHERAAQRLADETASVSLRHGVLAHYAGRAYIASGSLRGAGFSPSTRKTADLVVAGFPMPLLAAVVLALFALVWSPVQAQVAPTTAIPAAGPQTALSTPAAPSSAPAPATATPPPTAQPGEPAGAPAPEAAAPLAPPADEAARAREAEQRALALESQLAVNLPSPVAPADPQQSAQLGAERTQLGDAWVAFEEQRDGQTRKAERAFFGVMLGLEAGLGIAYAAVAKDASDTSRVIAGVSSALAFGALVPSVTASSRKARRAWFTAGAAAFAFGAGATLFTAPEEKTTDHSARWVGASVALQGLAMIPLAFIPGFPEEADYAAYQRLPAAQRADAAARILARIDRFEQRAAAIALTGALAGAAVMAAGALAATERDQARTLGGLCLIPVGTVLLALAPRLFVRSRLDRYSVGERPTKLPFNGW